MNPRITAKERGLLKGAIRRVFSRSDLRRAVIEASTIQHTDTTRKKVKTWCKCAICKLPEAKSNMQVDHIEPIVPIDTTLEQMLWDEVVNNTWCGIIMLQAVCKPCHKSKTQLENKERRLRRKNEQ